MTCFADAARVVTTEIVENVRLAKSTYRVRFRAAEMAAAVVPGQFFMLRNPATNDPLIGRALAVYDIQPEEGTLDLVYVVKGKLTTSLERLGRGQLLTVWGPLGNGFSPQPAEHLIMVAGGIGQTPFLCLAKEALGRQTFGDPVRAQAYSSRVTFCYGVRSAEYLAGVEQFRAAGCDVRLAAEDGTHGPARRVTELLEEVLQEQSASSAATLEDSELSTQALPIRIVCCGPEPMMEAVARIAQQHELPCEVSLETPMACGIGICFTCVAKIGTAQDWDYKRTCVEGPVFDANCIQWH